MVGDLLGTYVCIMVKIFYICTMFMYLIDIFIYYRSIDIASRE